MARRDQGRLGAAVGAARALERKHATRAAVLVGLGVSVLFLWLALRNVDFGDVWQALTEVEWWVIPPALVVLAFGVWLRIERWRVLFVPETRPPFGAATRATLVGLMFNLLLPLRAGEAARIVVLNREAGNARSEILATAVVERVFDVLALLVLLLVAAPFVPHVSWLKTAAVVAGILAAALAVGVVLLVRHDERPIRWALRLVPFVSDARADQWAAHLLRGFASVRSTKMAVQALALTLASWLVVAGSTAIVLLGFDYGLGFGAGLLVVVATNLALVLPAAPAGVGPYEAGVVLALKVFDVDKSQAVSAALLLHAINFVPFVIAGYVAMLGRRRATSSGIAQSPAAQSTSSAGRLGQRKRG